MTTAQTWVPNDSATDQRAAGGNLAGTVSFDAVRLQRLRSGGRAIYTTTRRRLRGLPADRVARRTRRSQPHGTLRVVLVVGELRQHQPRSAGHPGELPRDVGA